MNTFVYSDAYLVLVKLLLSSMHIAISNSYVLTAKNFFAYLTKSRYQNTNKDMHMGIL